MSLLTSGLAVHAGDPASLPDSLPQMTAEPKLEALRNRAISARDTGAGTETEERTILQFLREARSQKNKQREAEALQMLLVHYLNSGDKERFFAASEGVGEFYLDNGFTDLYWEYLFLEVKALLYTNDSEKAIGVTGEMYDRAKSMNDAYGLALAACLMGNAYEIAEKNDAALESFLESWSYVKQVKDVGKRARLVYYCGVALVRELNHAGQYDRSLTILDEWSQNVEESMAWAKKTGESTFTVTTSSIHCDLLLAETCLLMGDYEEAEAHLSRVASMMEGTPLAKNYYLYLRRALYKEKGDHEAALVIDAELKDYYAAKGEVLGYQSTVSDMRESLKALGRYREAVEMGDEIIALADSLSGIKHLDRLNELHTIYGVDKLEAEKQRQRTIIISVSTGCLLLVLIVVIYITYSLHLRRKNLSLYNRIRELTRAEKETERILELIPGEQLSREMKLFRELTHLMHSEKLFLDPAIDRRSVAIRLGTNEKYLANAIHEGAADTTFAGYISSLRLACSLDLLTGRPDMPLDQVAEQSGHGSYSPFFKAFVKKYGMSPSQYRKLYAAKPAEGVATVFPE